MKVLKCYYLIIALAVPLFLAACADKDVYDPDKVRPVAPVENPLGEDFIAPEGFEWSMLSTVKLNIEVKDEFNGLYNYLIEVFTLNPLSDATAVPFTAGYAKGNNDYVTEISIPKATERIFIRQTDPKQRKEIYEYIVPKNGGELNCKLFFTEVSNRATSNSNHGTSGWDQITPMNIEENSVNGLQDNHSFIHEPDGYLTNGSTFIIDGQYDKPLTADKGQANIIVKGIWKMSGRLQGLTIYVIDGGKISGDAILMGTGSTIEIQKGGDAEFTGFRTDTKNTIKNFGTFKAENISRINSECVIYNAKEATFEVTKNIDDFTSSALHNHGNFIVGGKIYTNNNENTCIIANYETGYIKATEFTGGAKAFINNNIVELEKYDANNITNGWLYNNCTFIAKQSFKFTQLVIDNGSITGVQNGDSWESTAVSSWNSGSLTLKNGSIIKATTFTCGSTLTIDAGTLQPSMVQAETITYEWTTYLRGNLILAVNHEVNAGVQASWGVSGRRYEKEPSVKITKKDEAKEEIETCTGIIHEGNPGNPDPEDPTQPDVEDNTVYTYAFEDQWPAYGDFDMNDVVITIDKISTTNSGKQVSVQGHVRAVGASRKTGIGIQFLNISSSEVALSGKVQNGIPTFESGQSNPVVILCTNAHKYCKPNIADDDYTFYCTDPVISSEYNSGDGANFEIKMIFPTAEEAVKATNSKNIDVFIITKDAHGVIGRTEVHTANYAPTNLGATELFGMGNDASTHNYMLNKSPKGYYLSTEGLAWGICIPYTEVWKWPKERQMITNVYPGFKPWVLSGGKVEDLTWVSEHNDNIFAKP